MGKGIGLGLEGNYIAFTAGTGCLVFIDLVAYLLRKNLGIMGREEQSQIGPGFKFIFYISFPNREEAICYDLCMGLQELSEQHGFKNFEFIARFSSEAKERWDMDFIDKQLEVNGSSLKKVWVCGPPVMNE